jgi:hypothetical protein
MQDKARDTFYSPTQRLSDAVENTHRFKEDLKRRDARRNYAVGIQHISDALIACGYIGLDQQAKALGIHRSTAWTIIKRKHKLGRLSTKTTNRMLANPELPPSVRAIVHRYLTERCDALGGRLKRR